jgi:hypothetical protein
LVTVVDACFEQVFHVNCNRHFYSSILKVDLQPSDEQLKNLSATFNFKRFCSQSAQKRRRLVFYWLRIDHRPLTCLLFREPER